MAAKEWNKSTYPGIRYRVHPDRRHGNAPDKYLQLLYKWQGKTVAEAIGWITKTGINEKEASFILADLQRAQRTGEGPRTLAEKRALEEQARHDDRLRREEEQAERLRLEQEQRIEGITFGQVWAQYAEDASRSKKPSTWEREAQMFADWIEPELIRVPMKKITPFLCTKIAKMIQDAGKSPRTAYYALQVIRQVINWAKAQDPALYQGDNPVTVTKKPRISNQRMRFLSHEEADRLLAALKEGGQGSNATHDMTLLSLHGGLRFGEIATLRWRDLNLQEGSLYIRPSVAKSNKGRTVYMTTQVKTMLQGRPKGGPDDLIFPARGGGVRKQISKFFDRTVEALGLNMGKTSREDKVVFHTCRHTCASWLVCSGVGLYQVQQLLGHSDYAMTTRYSHLAPDNLRQTASILEQAVSKAKGAKVIPMEAKR